MRKFLKDEAGTVTVEMVLWITFLIPTAIMLGETVVGPLIANAQQQAALNADGLAVIEQALAICGGQP